jgi:signal recognition particle subunit SEC65
MADDWKDFEIGTDIDVSQIMEKIRERIARKQKEGIYTEEGIAELTDAKIMQFAEEAEIDSVLLEKLRSPDHSWNIQPSYLITTHRTGFKAKTIVLIKKFIRPFVRLYTDHLVGRQAQINQYFAHLLHNLVRELTRHQIDNNALKARLERLEREKEFLENRVKTFELMAVMKDENTDHTT